MQRINRRLTYANVMSSIAVFLVLGGATALAATHLAKHSVGSAQLKPGSVTTSKLRSGAVTGSRIRSQAITGRDIAPGAVGAGQLAAGSVGNGQTQLVKVFKGGAVPAAESREAAPRVELGSVGPFRFYGKCFLEAGRVHEVTFIELTSGLATLGTEDGDTFESNTEGFLTSSSPEQARELENDASAAANSFDATSDDEEFQASASDGTEITGLVGGTGAKQGTPPAGDGPFLAGNSCIVGSIAIFGG